MSEEKEEVLSEEELSNRKMFPKDTCVEEINNNIAAVKKAIINAIDDVQENENLSLTVTEINSALIGALAQMNSKELVNVLKYKKSLDSDDEQE